jgi:hypothetical protein
VRKQNSKGSHGGPGFEMRAGYDDFETFDTKGGIQEVHFHCVFLGWTSEQ